jgi:hypothetical protein
VTRPAPAGTYAPTVLGAIDRLTHALVRCTLHVARRVGLPVGPARLGTCPFCYTSVFEDDDFIRYRGAYYHRSPCASYSRGRGVA